MKKHFNLLFDIISDYDFTVCRWSVHGFTGLSNWKESNCASTLSKDVMHGADQGRQYMYPVITI